MPYNSIQCRIASRQRNKPIPLLTAWLVASLILSLAQGARSQSIEPTPDDRPARSTTLSQLAPVSPYSVEILANDGSSLHYESMVTDARGSLDLAYLATLPAVSREAVALQSDFPATVVVRSPDGTLVERLSLLDPDVQLARLAEAARFESFLQRVKRQEPDPTRYEFVGRVQVGPDHEKQPEPLAANDRRRSHDSGATPTTAELEQMGINAPDIENGDLEILVSADGRMYRERPGTRSRGYATAARHSWGGDASGSVVAPAIDLDLQLETERRPPGRHSRDQR